MHPSKSPTPPRRNTKKILTVIIVVLAGIFTFGAFVLLRYWPFTEASVRAKLGANVAADVHFGRFHTKYFPPGCVVENVIFQRNNSNTQLISIRQLTIRSSLLGLFRHHLSLLRADGARVELVRSDIVGARSSGQRVTIDEFVADDAVLEIPQGKDRQPLKFVFHKFHLENLGDSMTTKFSAAFENPLPAGLVRTSGQFGPWSQSDAAVTQVSGKYSLENADLGVIQAVGGRISSTGTFAGTFKEIDVRGHANSPEFEITSTQHKQPLTAEFEAKVNAVTGEMLLPRVVAKFGRDEIQAQGNMGRQADGKRAAVIQLACDHGRIEDTFYPFISSPKSPVTGNIQFRMHVVIPSGQQRFLQKINLTSDFRVTNVDLTNPQTKLRMNKVAEAPHQKAPVDERAQIDGRVNVSSGVAHLSSLDIGEGDASAQLHGTYNLVNQRLDMHGILRTEASLAKTTSGIKAAFAKALEPFVRKQERQKIIPVRISGTYRHPSFGLAM